jgi:hypothetical protein
VRTRESLAVPAIFGLFASARNATPAGDCAAWQARTVSSVNSGKSGLNIGLDGGALHLWYFLLAPGWIDGL